MNRYKATACAFVFLMTFFSISVSAGEPQAAEKIQQQEVGVPVLESNDGLPTYLSAGNGQNERGRKGGSLQATGERSQQRVAICDEYTITCSNGKTDSCCGSLMSCLVYCSEVCGGPCAPAEQ